MEKGNDDDAEDELKIYDLWFWGADDDDDDDEDEYEDDEDDNNDAVDDDEDDDEDDDDDDDGNDDDDDEDDDDDRCRCSNQSTGRKGKKSKIVSKQLIRWLKTTWLELAQNDLKRTK